MVIAGPGRSRQQNRDEAPDGDLPPDGIPVSSGEIRRPSKPVTVTTAGNGVLVSRSVVRPASVRLRAVWAA